MLLEVIAKKKIGRRKRKVFREGKREERNVYEDFEEKLCFLFEFERQ